jgi:exoribonuclease R
MARERARGGVSLPAPEQDVVPTDGGYALTYRASLAVESWNAQISLATGIAAARLMRSAGVGILRTLDPARAEDVARIRRAAAALAIDWAPEESYGDLLRRLDAARPRDAAFLDEATTMFRNAGYRTFGAPARDPDDDAGPGPAPHAAIGAEYAHVTAPLRRLVDRYGLEVCLAASSGAAVPGWVLAALPALPAEMVTAARRAGAYARAGIEAVEAAVLAGRLGETFPGVIVDVRAPKTAGDPWRGEVVLADLAVRALVTGASLPLGERVRVRLVEASLPRRTVRFERVG